LTRRRGSLVARTAALLALGGLAVHQLRYLLVFGSDSGAELHQQGHDYLAQALPILVALAVAAIVARLVVGSARYSPCSAPTTKLARGLIYAAALAAVFWGQELAEGALAAGHPSGLAAVLDSGAWIAIPLALGLGLAAAAAEWLLDRAERAIASALDEGTTPLSSAGPLPAPSGLARAPRVAHGLAFGLARRPPPLIAIT
jgi:hypothetical protein